jgi:hypothetical protein
VIGFLKGTVQRRGAHVNTLKTGSRGEDFCFGGISGVYAKLRRECVWGNFDLGVFVFLGGCSREVGEEGGLLGVSPSDWGNF